MPHAPSTDNYTLGKGKLYFNRLLSTGAYDGLRAVGNMPELTMNVDVETLEHFSSQADVKKKDKDTLLSITPMISFVLDELNDENIALNILGDITSVTQSSGTAVEKDLEGVKQGRFYELDKRSVSNVAVSGSVLDTDFSVVAGAGLIYIIPGGNIADDADITVTFDAAEVIYSKITGMSQSSIEGMVLFVSDNPAGPDKRLYIWRVALKPDGDTAYIGDDWSTLSFTGEILADETGHPTEPYLRIEM